MVKIVSWNVTNTVRLPHLIELDKTVKPDIVMLQETKSTDENFPEEEISSLGYQIIKSGQKSYNGVAILSKAPIKKITDILPGNKEDAQARFIDAQVQVENPFNIVSLYLPNGNPFIDTGQISLQIRLDEEI